MTGEEVHNGSHSPAERRIEWVGEREQLRETPLTRNEAAPITSKREW